MKITRTSQASGVTRTRDMDVTPEQIELWEEGMHIQDAAPHLSDADREFLMTGITAEEWDEAFPDDEDEPHI